MASKRSMYFWPVVFGAVAMLLLIAAFILRSVGTVEVDSTPSRAVVDDSSTIIPTITTSADTKTAPKPSSTALSIEGSSITRVKVPAVAIDLAVSGETLPRKTKNCHGADECIDPPIPNQAAWYGEVPSLPSKGTVRLFGHTSWIDPSYAAFNNLPAVKKGDRIVVVTKTGTFDYVANAPRLVPYDQVSQSKLLWSNSPDRLVMVTCNSKKSSGTVVEAHLVSARPR